MGLRLFLQKHATNQSRYCSGLRWAHAAAQPPPFSAAIDHFKASPATISPEIDRHNKIGLNFPSFGFFGGAMELMAVPKRKTSPHKRGIRNGPKALKPHPVIVRCKSCGRVKLQHYFCCSGIKEHTGEHEK